MKQRLLFLLALCIGAGLAMAGPDRMRYQGRLVRDGQPVNGQVSIAFRFFDAPEQGQAFYEDLLTVDVVDGAYAVEIGSGTPLDPALFARHELVYLELAVDGVPMQPRERIVSVAYAFTADFAKEAEVAHRLVAPEPAQDTPPPETRHVGQTTNASFFVHKNGTAQQIGHLFDTKVVWSTADFDNGMAFNDDNNQYEAPVDGYYRFTAQAHFNQGIDVGALARIVLTRNTTERLSVFIHRAAVRSSFSIATTRDVYLDAGDIVAVYLGHSSSGALELRGSREHTYFSGYLLHE